MLKKQIIFHQYQYLSRLASAFCQICVSEIAVTWRCGMFLKCILSLRTLIKNLSDWHCYPNLITLRQGFEEKELKKRTQRQSNFRHVRRRDGALTTTLSVSSGFWITSELKIFGPKNCRFTQFVVSWITITWPNIPQIGIYVALVIPNMSDIQFSRFDRYKQINKFWCSLIKMAE